MNKDFKIENNKTIIFTDNKGTVEREASNNIEEILVCENNIEEMERDIQYSLNHITLAHNKAWSNWSTIGAAVIWLAGFIFSSSMGLITFALIQLLGSIGIAAYGISSIKRDFNSIKANKHIIKELKNNLQIEKEKLNELNKDKTNDLINSTQPIKRIHRSEEIHNLKRKLVIISYYEMHKTKLISEYKKGILREKISDNKEYHLLEELIKNDLNKNEEKTSSKQKVLEKK